MTAHDLYAVKHFIMMKNFDWFIVFLLKNSYIFHNVRTWLYIQATLILSSTFICFPTIFLSIRWRGGGGGRSLCHLSSELIKHYPSSSKFFVLHSLKVSKSWGYLVWYIHSNYNEYDKQLKVYKECSVDPIAFYLSLMKSRDKNTMKDG